MAIDETSTTGGALELEKKRTVNPWAILAAVIFVIAFFVGWRSVAKTGDVSDSDVGQPS